MWLWGGIWALCCGVSLTRADDGMGAVAAVTSPESAIDFVRDIQPLLQRRCLACHGAKAEGDLRLDARRFAARGGHTGSPILGGDAATNAILQRITTADASLRMPKDRPPLSDDEQQILRRWVEAGTPWTDPPRHSATATGSYEITWESLQPWDPREWPNARFRTVEWWFWRFGVALIPILLWIGTCDRTQQWVRDNHPRTQPPRGALWRRLAATPRSAHVAALLAFSLVGMVVFYQQQARRADSQIAQLQLEVDRWEESLMPAAPPAGVIPSLTRPQHPPRLGGEYYRGNDERNPQLYNRGFYRTCVMRIWLCRADGSRLAWGDELDPAACQIRIEIEKSPGATEGLFAPEIMQNSYVSITAPGTPIRAAAREIFPFAADQPGRWVANVPIDLTAATQRPQTAQFYICRGRPPATDEKAQDPHYGADYTIRLENGKISTDSELWLTCLYRTGNVFVIPDGKIADDEWFSFRPIPEIVGEQTTTDPKLLGIEAYREELGHPGDATSRRADAPGP
jgi:hypothetical protein